MTSKKEIKEEKERKWKEYEEKRLGWFNGYYERKMERLRTYDNKENIKLEPELEPELKPELEDKTSIREYDTCCGCCGCIPFDFKDIINKIRN